MPDLRDNISHKTSLYRVPGLHDTIALKRLFAVCQIYVAIFPLKRLCIVCHAFVTQIITLPLNFTISEPAVLLVVLWRKTCLILFIFSIAIFFSVVLDKSDLLLTTSASLYCSQIMGFNKQTSPRTTVVAETEL